MEDSEAAKLENGLYEITWISGSKNSLAAVGRNQNGEVWYSPTNWLDGPTCLWARVKSARLLMPEGAAGNGENIYQIFNYPKEYPLPPKKEEKVDPALVQITAAILGGFAANHLVVKDWEGISPRMIQTAVFSAWKALKEMEQF